MKVKVVCQKCQGIFDWKWGEQKGTCPHCGTNHTIYGVKMAKGEVMKLFQ